MTTRSRVTVLGSLNMDISVTVPRLPGPGRAGHTGLEEVRPEHVRYGEDRRIHLDGTNY